VRAISWRFESSLRHFSAPAPASRFRAEIPLHGFSILLALLEPGLRILTLARSKGQVACNLQVRRMPSEPEGRMPEGRAGTRESMPFSPARPTSAAGLRSAGGSRSESRPDERTGGPAWEGEQCYKYLSHPTTSRSSGRGRLREQCVSIDPGRAPFLCRTRGKAASESEQGLMSSIPGLHPSGLALPILNCNPCSLVMSSIPGLTLRYAILLRLSAGPAHPALAREAG
jgi:hypothetical protein